MRLRLVSRLARLYVLCQTRRYLPALEDLARDFGTCRRTILRDLAALHDAGVVVPPRLDQDREAA